MKKLRVFFVGLLLALPYLSPQSVQACAFDEVYILPVPSWMYLYGGAVALAVSLLIMGHFISKKSVSSYSLINLSRWSFFAIFTRSSFFKALKILSFFLFLLSIVSGIIGSNQPSSNFNMPFFWIIFALGFVYLTALLGNLWTIVNPWKICVEWFESLSGRNIDRRVIRYPESFGYYPALIFYFVFVKLELLSNITPTSLSIVIIQYTFVNFIGIILIGKEKWFRYCEFFSVLFRLISKISFIEYKKGKLYLRFPVVGLLKEKAEHFSLLVFILFMLSSTFFDGILKTTIWSGWKNFIGLLFSLVVFLVIYLAFIGLAKMLTESKLSLRKLALEFAFSLIPIALAYNIVHYYTLLLTRGQEIIRVISDPFGFGWNLFGTAGYQPNMNIVDLGFVWHSQLFFILLGHASAVYLGYAVALNIFPSHKKAMISQLSMTVLMIIYTMLGLWILSRPSV